MKKRYLLGSILCLFISKFSFCQDIRSLFPKNTHYTSTKKITTNGDDLLFTALNFKHNLETCRALWKNTHDQPQQKEKAPKRYASKKRELKRKRPIKLKKPSPCSGPPCKKRKLTASSCQKLYK